MKTLRSIVFSELAPLSPNVGHVLQTLKRQEKYLGILFCQTNILDMSRDNLKIFFISNTAVPMTTKRSRISYFEGLLHMKSHEGNNVAAQITIDQLLLRENFAHSILFKFSKQPVFSKTFFFFVFLYYVLILFLTT